MALIRVLLVGALLAVSACSQSPQDQSSVGFSDIANDENLVFFRTTAWFDDSDEVWNIPIHGWVYESEDSSVRKSAFELSLNQAYDLEADDESSANFDDRFNLLIADGERGKGVYVNIGNRSYEMPPTKPNGHFQTTLQISADQLDFAEASHILIYSATTQGDAPRTFFGETKLASTSGVSIISDIDDTVKISNVADRRKLLEQTFFLQFEPVPGVAEFYHEVLDDDGTLHFVSSSPWQLYPPLEQFADEHDFPWASFSLKSMRFRDTTLLNLFKPGTETKPPAIEAILEAHPDRTFILVGDSGEQDPEVYAQIIRKHPDRIAKVYIRNVTDETADNERFSSLFGGTDSDSWLLFDDATTLTGPH